MTDLFAYVKASVPSPEAAIRYGFTPDRFGNIRCPFHGEKTPSLQLYPGSRGWYCFGCGTGGDVISFTARLFGLSQGEAARKLAADFGLTIPDREPGPPAPLRRDWQADFEAWRNDTANRVASAIYAGNAALERGEPWSDAECLAVREQARLQNIQERLCDPHEVVGVFRYRKELDRLCCSILRTSAAKIASTSRRS